MTGGRLGTAAVPTYPQRAAAATKHNDTVFPPSVIWVGDDGDVNVVTAGGDTVLFPAMTAGSIVPVECKQVLATDTTATIFRRIW